MGRWWGLTTVWMVFTASAVGVGFAASGLIEYPRSAAAGPHPAGMLVNAPRTSPTPRSAATPPRQPPSPTVTAQPESPNQPTPTPALSTRGLSTVGGYVSGTCFAGEIRVSASPNPGWSVTDLSEPGEDSGEVGFARSGNIGSIVTVEAWCWGGVPTFAIDVDEADDELDPDLPEPEDQD